MNNEQEFRQNLEDNSNKTDTWKENIDAAVKSLDTGDSLDKILGLYKGGASGRFKKQFSDDWFKEKQKLGIKNWPHFLLFKWKPELKQCSKCHNVKNRNEFTKQNNLRDGLNTSCKKCESIRHLEYNNAHRKERAEYSKKYSAKKLKECLIYALINDLQEKIYIGATNAGKNRRKSTHYRELRNGNHSNKEMQADYNKSAQFPFYEVLEEVEFEHLLSERENYYKNRYFNMGWYLYSKPNDGGRKIQSNEQWLENTLREAEERGYNLKVA